MIGHETDPDKKNEVKAVQVKPRWRKVVEVTSSAEGRDAAGRVPSIVRSMYLASTPYRHPACTPIVTDGISTRSLLSNCGEQVFHVRNQHLVVLRRRWSNAHSRPERRSLKHSKSHPLTNVNIASTALDYGFFAADDAVFHDLVVQVLYDRDQPSRYTQEFASLWQGDLFA